MSVSCHCHVSVPCARIKHYEMDLLSVNPAQKGAGRIPVALYSRSRNDSPHRYAASESPLDFQGKGVRQLLPHVKVYSLDPAFNPCSSSR